MIEISLRRVGVIGPGFTGWPACREILAGRAAWSATSHAIPASALLPANERRRSNETTKLALAVAEEAMKGIEAREIATVFAASDTDGGITHRLCDSFAAPQPEVSPTHFHNSVHNAPAGYWSIAVQSQRQSTSLAADQDSFAAGLLEAAAQIHATRDPVLFVALDLPQPHPLSLWRPREHGFAVALLLAAQADGGALARLRLSLEAEAACSDLPRELASFSDNPAARSLPLLAAVARSSAETLRVGAIGSRQLAIQCLC